jgi:hypothetical protein
MNYGSASDFTGRTRWVYQEFAIAKSPYSSTILPQEFGS